MSLALEFTNLIHFLQQQTLYLNLPSKEKEKKSFMTLTPG